MKQENTLLSKFTLSFLNFFISSKAAFLKEVTLPKTKVLRVKEMLS